MQRCGGHIKNEPSFKHAEYIIAVEQYNSYLTQNKFKKLNFYTILKLTVLDI